jgi:cytoskeletal protein RodZ
MLKIVNLRDKQRGSFSRTLVVFLFAILVGIAAVVGIYLKQQNRIDSLNQKIATLNTQSAKQPDNTPSNQQTSRQNSTTYTSEKGVKIIVYSPAKNAKVSSPVAIIGEVPGNWSFEASFPVKVKDADGNTIAQGKAEVLGDWMTDKHVAFSAKLVYSSAEAGQGMVVLQKDNPSGMTDNDDTLSIPIQL